MNTRLNTSNYEYFNKNDLITLNIKLSVFLQAHFNKHV